MAPHEADALPAQPAPELAEDAHDAQEVRRLTA